MTAVALVTCDAVPRNGRLLLLEAEVNEPGLLFQYVPEAAPTFAEATLRWLDEATG